MFKGHSKQSAGLWSVMTAAALALAIGITPTFALADDTVADDANQTPQVVVSDNENKNEVVVTPQGEDDYSPAEGGSENVTVTDPAPATVGEPSDQGAPEANVPDNTPVATDVQVDNPVDVPAAGAGSTDTTPDTTPVATLDDDEPEETPAVSQPSDADETDPVVDDAQPVADDTTAPQVQQPQEVAAGSSQPAAQEITNDPTPVAPVAPVAESLTAAATKAKRIIEDGLYSMGIVGASGKVVTVNKGKANNGTPLVSAKSANEAYQKFFIEYDEEEGYYRIHILGTGKNVVVASKKVVESDAASADQLWEILSNGSGVYSFKNKETGLLMTLSNGNFVAAADTASGGTRKNTQKFTMTALDLLNSGFYFIRCQADKSLAITVDNNSSSETAKIILSKANNAQNQKFQVVRVGGVGSGLYRIRTTSSGGWLTEIGTTSTSQVKQKGNSKTPASDANTWKVCWNGSNWSLRNVESGYILSFAHPEAGKQLKVHKPNGNPKQHFEFVETQLVANGNYIVKSLFNGKALTIADSSLSNGGNAIVDKASSANNKKFKITKSGEYYIISNVFSGKRLAVADDSTANGANVLQWAEKGGMGQKWDIRIGDGGNLVFVNVKTGMALNVASNSKKNVNQGKVNGTSRQTWTVAPTTVKGWYHIGEHWRYKSTNKKARFEKDIDTKGKSLGHYDVLRDIWEKIRRKKSGTKYLIASSWDSCYVAVFEGKAGKWKPLYGFNCGNGNAGVIEAEVREEKPGSTWRWSPSWDRYLAKSNVRSRMPELPPNNQWARKLGTTFKTSRVKRVNANEKYFTSVSWTLGYHTYLHSKKELGRHLSHGCQRLAPKWAKWIYKNAAPMTRCIQMRTKAYV